MRQGPVKAVGAAAALSSLQASRDFIPVNEPFRSRRPCQSEGLWPFNDFHLIFGHPAVSTEHSPTSIDPTDVLFADTGETACGAAS
jgi:hypothetical protein